MKNIQKFLLIFVLFFIFLSSGCNENTSKQKKFINVKGSDTMVILSNSLAEEFMKLNKNVNISVLESDSGTGITGLLNKTLDIAASSRKITDKELYLAAEKGIETKEYPVARDGIAIIVNPDNPVKSLSSEEIEKIFTGDYSDWMEVGGDEMPITVCVRESSSGTYIFFQEYVLNKKDYTVKAKYVSDTSDIIEAVAKDKEAVGYIGLEYASIVSDKVKIIGFRKQNGKVVMPSKKTVADGSYPFSRMLYFYTTSDASEMVRSFIDFSIGPDGQDIATENEYVPVNYSGVRDRL